MIEDKIEPASDLALDFALDALSDAEEWGVGEQIQDMVFQDTKFNITDCKFVIDRAKSGWRYIPGAFPGLWEVTSLFVQGKWVIDYEAAHKHGGTFIGQATWNFGAELDREAYPEVWSQFPEDDDACLGCGSRPGDGVTPECNHPEGCGFNRKREADARP